MLARAKNVGVRALIRSRMRRFGVCDGRGYRAHDSRSTGCERGAVQLARLPLSFLVARKQKKTCSLVLEVDPARIERAELHVVTWTGGPVK